MSLDDQFADFRDNKEYKLIPECKNSFTGDHYLAKVGVDPGMEKRTIYIKKCLWCGIFDDRSLIGPPEK